MTARMGTARHWTSWQLGCQRTPGLPSIEAHHHEAARALQRRVRRHGLLHWRLQHLFQDVLPPIQRGVVTHGGLRHFPLHQTCQGLVDPSLGRLLGQRLPRSRQPPIPIPALGRLHLRIQGHIPGSRLRGRTREKDEDDEDGGRPGHHLLPEVRMRGQVGRKA